jgi:hypothetical protein
MQVSVERLLQFRFQIEEAVYGDHGFDSRKALLSTVDEIIGVEPEFEVDRRFGLSDEEVN